MSPLRMPYPDLRIPFECPYCHPPTDWRRPAEHSAFAVRRRARQRPRRRSGGGGHRCAGLVHRENIPALPASDWSIVRIYLLRGRQVGREALKEERQDRRVHRAQHGVGAGGNPSVVSPIC
eukprot:3867291-Pyramimonas_sp.AAC.2